MKKKSQQNSQIWYMLLWFGGITILTVIDQLTKHLAVKSFALPSAQEFSIYMPEFLKTAITRL